MPVNSLPGRGSWRKFKPGRTENLPEFSGADVDPESSFSGYRGRRRKAAATLVVVWSGTVALHLTPWGLWLALMLTAVAGVHVLRLVLARPVARDGATWEEVFPDDTGVPFVSLLVPAKNEAAVIGNLMRSLCCLDYPADAYEVWAIDDGSTDDTPLILQELTQQYAQLKVFRRDLGRGGKSGALNQVWPQAKGDIVAVFDADAHVDPKLLHRVLPLFQTPDVGAVQVRKAIANHAFNYWTRSQSAEMALDSFFQQQRIAIGGLGELRGNGQFVRRAALERCGGFNEETITDDLDLTFRLHLDCWDIEFLMVPAVGEEGVTSAMSLWHQRNRWAEGGYQRYLDYWQLIARRRMGWKKTIDAICFWLFQYFLPLTTAPDLVMAIARHRLPIFGAFTGLVVGASTLGMFIGMRRIQRQENLPPTPIPLLMLQTLQGMIYMIHWMVVIAFTTARISVRPKRLKWVKTVHQGQ